MKEGNTIPASFISEENPGIDVGFSLLLSSTGEEIRSRLMGRILTIIDASLPEGRQTESLKDLIRQEINQTDTEVWRHVNKFSMDYELIPLHKKAVNTGSLKD
jgi:hypothetical protein